jgi:hypothetical protein
MYLLGYPKPLRYLNRPLECITRESSTPVVDCFFFTATIDFSLPFDWTLRMRWRRQLDPDCGTDQRERSCRIRSGSSTGDIPQRVDEYLRRSHQ